MTSKRLTPQRLYSDPPLVGGEPRALKFSPGGHFLTYCRAAEDDRERMDLWRIDVATGTPSLWLNASQLLQRNNDVTALTPEERAERERRRQFSFGITAYDWHPDGKHLLIPNDGNALLVNTEDNELQTRAICPAGTRQSGFTLSPKGSWLSYVRSGNLYATQVDEISARDTEIQLTDDGGGTVTNGLPDFLAAEEMHRFQGHWWTLDERFIVYTKVDEATVEPSYRMEIDANGARTIEQRYPYAGGVNPRVELWLVDVTSGQQRKIWQNTIAPDKDAQDAYLARVTMGQNLIYLQTQDRLQQRLTLSCYDIELGTWRTLYQEQSDTWINLTDDLTVLDKKRLIFSSEASGTRSAMLLEISEHEVCTHHLAGPAHVLGIVAVHGDQIYVSGWDQDPMECHLYRLSLDGQTCQLLTEGVGVHDAVVHTQSGQFLDRFSSSDTPVRLSLQPLDPTSKTTSRVLFEQKIESSHPYYEFKDQHVEPIFGEIVASDGQRLCYRLTPPADFSGKHATIVYVYGGPGPQKSRREWTPLTVQLFAQNGFAVLELDNRGTGNRGQAFEAPIYRQMSHVEVADQVAGLAALRDHAWADLDRVGIYGHSYGGYMTLMALCQASEHFHAGVAVAPVSDWTLYDSHYTERYMGLPADNVEGYKQSNVLTHLHNLDAPLLLMHGMADDNVLFSHSTMIMARLQGLQKPFELMTYPGAKHSMQERDVSIHLFTMILDFFERTLNSHAQNG